MRPTEVPHAAAVLYGLAISLDVAADHPIARDPTPVIEAGRSFVRSTPQPSEGRDRVFWLDASAGFLRSWARLEEPTKAADLIAAAEDLEAARDLAIATLQRDDA